MKRFFPANVYFSRAFSQTRLRLFGPPADYARVINACILSSLLLCDTAYLSVSWLELLCDLFLPVVQSQALEEHDTLTTCLYTYILYSSSDGIVESSLKSAIVVVS